MVPDDIFHFVGRPHIRQVSITVQVSEPSLSLHLTVRKTLVNKSVNFSYLLVQQMLI